MSGKQRLAIIGTGISGLACAHFLREKFDLTIYEQDDRIGGHSNTVFGDAEKTIPIDTGFMVYNEVTYPLLTRLFAELNVTTQPTSMSFSVQHTGDRLEFNGGSLNLLFGQRKNLLRPRFWKMLFQINRFNTETISELENPQYPDLTLAEYVEKRGYGQDFLRWYLSPMAAAVWSSPPERIETFPAHTLMRFWHNHGFLGLDTQHPWRTVINGSRQYVGKLSASFEDSIHRSSPVAEITQENEIVLADGSRHSFDLVISAAHGDQALRMLANPTPMEKEVLGQFHYQANEAVLHSDPRFMPQTRRCWASWNYRIDGGRHSTIYWMNRLQDLPGDTPYFVSINPSSPIAEDHVVQRIAYEHPLFDLEAIAAQDRIPELHADGDHTGRYYCGAWQRYGFHEDGLWSAVRLCEAILKKDPWS